MLDGVNRNLREVEPLEVRSVMCITVCKVAKSTLYITITQQAGATRFTTYTVVVLLLPIPLENTIDLAVANVMAVK